MVGLLLFSLKTGARVAGPDCIGFCGEDDGAYDGAEEGGATREICACRKEK